MRHPPTMHTCSLSMVAHSYGLAVLKHSSSFAHSEFSVLTDSLEHSLVFAQTVRANGRWVNRWIPTLRASFAAALQ